jgi:hypothetical protein
VPAYPRDEMDRMWAEWIAANKRCEAARDWRPMADLYDEEATYGWNSGANDDFMAVGREEIRNYALGLEMAGLEGWTYPYQAVVIDDRAGMVIGLWKQVAGERRPDGTPYEVAGFGASWFGYGGEGRWAWQRDFYDSGNAGAVFFEMIQAGVLSDVMSDRIKRAISGELAPGHYRRGQTPVPLWPTVA